MRFSRLSTNRRKALRGALLVLALIALSLGWRKWSEPRYAGRTVRSWIEQLPYDNASNSEAQRAMTAFGEQAIPHLIDAVKRPLKWDIGLLAKIPRKYLDPVLDLDRQQSVSSAANWRLQLLVLDEIERNELEANPRYPVLDRVLPIWRELLRSRSPSDAIDLLPNLGLKMTNVAPELVLAFQRLSPRQWEWSQAIQLLAETRDPKLTQLFLNYTGPAYSEETRGWAVHALARNGHPDGEVARALSEALVSTNTRLQSLGLIASAHLNLCEEQALKQIDSIRNLERKVDNQERIIEFVEPVLRWRSNTNDNEAIAAIERNLAPGSSGYLRIRTADLLQSAGPAARQFVPALEQMALDQALVFAAPAVRALRTIDPDVARRLIPRIPKISAMQAKTASASR